MTAAKRTVVKLPASSLAKPKAVPATKRITIELEPRLHADLVALAEEQRRELKRQVLVILEAAVKAAKGQKKARERKQRLRDIYGS